MDSATFARRANAEDRRREEDPSEEGGTGQPGQDEGVERSKE